jgi:hypothetical protein
MRLDEAAYTTGQVAALSGVPEKSVRNWDARGVLPLGESHFTGRRLFTLTDALKLAVMADLTGRVGVSPSDAAGAATLVARAVIAAAPPDADGHPTLDPNSVPPTRAYALAILNGEMHVGTVDSAEPGEWSGEWGRAHIVLPIAPLLANLAFRLLSLRTGGPA